jgi:hypothetical protein
MPRLRNEVTGVIVNVDDATAEYLGAGWADADAVKPAGSSDGASGADGGSGNGTEDGRPAGNASAEEWEAYALANGRTAEELQGLGRNEIRDLFPKE